MASAFENLVTRAYNIAAERHHESVTLEHLLAALIEVPDIQETIKEVGANYTGLLKEITRYLNDGTNHVIVAGGSKPIATGLFRTIVKKAKTQSIFSNTAEISIPDVFLAMFNIEESPASYMMHIAGLDKETVLKHLKKKHKVDEAADPEKNAEDVLRQFCVNLNEKAKAGKIDPLIGRAKEVESITQIMARRNKHNVIMLGDPGVGKTIIVEGLAKRIAEGDVPATLADKVIWSLDMGSLVAGTKFRGDFEERMKQVIVAFSATPNAIMFIDEIHMIMGAGGGNQGAMDAANMLKPALSRGEIRCIGSTTLEEYRKHFEKDRALGRRFQRLDIHEPSIEDTKKILHSLTPYYSKYHGVEYEPEALDAAVELSVRYMHGKFLPDKAIDIVDSAGARQKIRAESEREKVITVELIKKEVSRIARVPIEADKKSENTKLATLEERLKEVVIGQDKAVDTVIDSVLIGQSGLRDGNKTQGAFLFVGSSGTGKTELAKQLALSLGISFVRFDMSEFQEKHTVSKFIGSPPGYVGYGDGQTGSGLLINTLENTPHAVILCDEIEKAHPDVINIFLQLMDNGRISSQSGKEADGQHIYLIFTSNLGAAAMEKPVIGFGDSERQGEDTVAVNQWFAPEFRNRLDAIVMFNRLTKDNMDKILDKFLGQLTQTLQPKNIHTVFDADARNWLIDKGFDRNMGARPLARVINENIKKPLSREILFGKLKDGGTVSFTVIDEKLTYNVVTADVASFLNEIDPSDTNEGVNV